MVQIIDFTTQKPLKKNQGPQFDAIEADFDNIDEAESAANDADIVVSDLQAIRAKALELKTLIASTWSKSYHDRTQRTVNTADVLTEEGISEAVDEVFEMIEVEYAKHKKYFKDCEDTAQDMIAEERGY